jgi:hypothetical protein
MGFNTTATTATLTAKLTPLGRRLLVTNTNVLISRFALGDSDANYNATEILTTGEVPAMGGDIGKGGIINNSTGNDTNIKYPLFLTSQGGNLKAVDPASINVTNNLSKLGQEVNLSGVSITENIININDWATDSLVNLFTSFNLPVNQTQKNTYTATTFTSGGWSDTALSGLASDKILVIGIDNSMYGETLDGREIQLVIPTSAGTFTLYSTFQNKGFNLTREDGTYKDTSINTTHLGNSLAFLVSDDILAPNGGDVSKSWATGFGDVKPFSVGKKELYNLTTNSNLSLTADTVVGVAYLGKGFLVVTEPTIVDAFSTSFSGDTLITYNSMVTEVAQNVTCVAGRGEFGTSSNPTWATGDTVRVSEIGLYDKSNNLIAYGKFDQQILKTIDGFSSFGIKITV